MAELIRWEPFRETRRLHDMLDRAMDRSLLDNLWFDGGSTGHLALDMYQTDDEVVVKANIPGIKPEHIEISVSGDTLTIQGELKQETDSDNAQYMLRERRYASFARSVTLPSTVEAEQAKAEFEHGVLTLTLPKAEEVRPKRISVKAK
jgi:HSP20 family protein